MKAPRSATPRAAPRCAHGHSFKGRRCPGRTKWKLKSRLRRSSSSPPSWPHGHLRLISKNSNSAAKHCLRAASCKRRLPPLPATVISRSCADMSARATKPNLLGKRSENRRLPVNCMTKHTLDICGRIGQEVPNLGTKRGQTRPTPVEITGKVEFQTNSKM
jgi:hypothetical protein